MLSCNILLNIFANVNNIKSLKMSDIAIVTFSKHKMSAMLKY